MWRMKNLKEQRLLQLLNLDILDVISSSECLATFVNVLLEPAVN